MGCLLIREAWARWKMQWSVAFLAIAYGIFEEGLVTRAYFNPYWFGQGALSANTMFFGVQWGWTILLEVFHASISTLVPIYLISSLWPELDGKPLVGKKGIVLGLLGAILAIYVGMVALGGGRQRPDFFPNPMLLVVGAAAIIILAALAYKFKQSRIMPKKWLFSPSKIAFIAFFFQGANFWAPNILAQRGIQAAAIIVFQFLIVVGYAFFAATQLLNEKTERKHIVAFAFGSVLLWVVVDVMIGIAGRIDLLAVAPAAFILLLIWRRRALK